jgi:DNA polymerase I-like protein with 3'-5' exonuclease and polymerase domains
MEVPDQNADELAEILRKTMIQAKMMFLKKVPVEVEVKVSDSWAGKS